MKPLMKCELAVGGVVEAVVGQLVVRRLVVGRLLVVLRRRLLPGGLGVAEGREGGEAWALRSVSALGLGSGLGLGSDLGSVVGDRARPVFWSSLRSAKSVWNEGRDWRSLASTLQSRTVMRTKLGLMRR